VSVVRLCPACRRAHGRPGRCAVAFGHPWPALRASPPQSASRDDGMAVLIKQQDDRLRRPLPVSCCRKPGQRCTFTPKKGRLR